MTADAACNIQEPLVMRITPSCAWEAGLQSRAFWFHANLATRHLQGKGNCIMTQPLKRNKRQGTLCTGYARVTGTGMRPIVHKGFL